MKVIVSHDVDHLTVWEHNRDLFIPKHIVRSIIEYLTGSVQAKELVRRFANIRNNQFNNIDNLMKYDKNFRIPSTFFIGVNKGKGLNYSIQNASHWIRKILQNGLDVGVHGIAYDNLSQIKFEHDLFREISNISDFGIRMHYLRGDQKTIRYLHEAGYLFDASVYSVQNPFKYIGIWEFPLNIMDAHIFHHGRKWQNWNLDRMKEATKVLIGEVLKKRMEYCSLLFHDCFFHDSFKTKKDWYTWIIQYLKGEGFEFVNYRRAIQEIEQ